MLDVQRRVDIDAVVQQFDDILIPLGVTAPRSVGVCELVDKHEGWFACENGIDVHFLQDGPTVLDGFAGKDLEPGEKFLRFAPAMCFHVADQNSNSLRPGLVRGLEHVVGFSHARAHSEEYLQPPLCLPFLVPFQGLEKVVGVRPPFVDGCHQVLCVLHAGLVTGYSAPERRIVETYESAMQKSTVRAGEIPDRRCLPFSPRLNRRHWSIHVAT